MQSLVDKLFNAMMNADVDIVVKPWGSETMFTTHEFILKLIKINDGARTSLQFHRQKDEVIHVLSGAGGVHVYADGEYDPAGPFVFVTAGERVHIPRLTLHRSIGPVTLLEFTSHPNDDVVRISDDYNRKSEIHGAA